MLKQSDLEQFTGTEQYFYHLNAFRYTSGVRYLAEHGEAYWLLDAIASYQQQDGVKEVPFQIWILTKNDDDSAKLIMKEDVNQPILVSQDIPYTDFPLTSIKLYFIDGVLILPSEY